MAIQIRLDPPLSPAPVKALWDKVPALCGRDPESVTRSIAGASLMATAWDEEHLVGTARVLTDGVYFAALVDVVVHPDYRRQGIGRRLITAAMEPFSSRGFQVAALGVDPHDMTFFERLGFFGHPPALGWQR